MVTLLLPVLPVGRSPYYQLASAQAGSAGAAPPALANVVRSAKQRQRGRCDAKDKPQSEPPKRGCSCLWAARARAPHTAVHVVK
eukprot:COSAG05_NODE_14180_length_405_cov_0.833333_1_plen_83_part_01